LHPTPAILFRCGTVSERHVERQSIYISIYCLSTYKNKFNNVSYVPLFQAIHISKAVKIPVELLDHSPELYMLATEKCGTTEHFS
jgi:hypothetical protein